MRMLRRLIGILVLVMVVLAMVQMVGAQGVQTWYFTGDTKPSGALTADDDKTHTKDNLLHKGEATTTGHSFYLPYDEVAWFYADTGAECDVGFGEHAWTAHIRTEAIEDDEIGETLKVEIGKVTPGGGVTVLAEGSKSLTAVGSKTVWDITCEDNGATNQDFSTGDWLGVRISWTCTTDKLRIYYGTPEVGEDSTIRSPSSDPGYPVPELSTLILLSTGLLALAGYVLLTKKRK